MIARIIFDCVASMIVPVIRISSDNRQIPPAANADDGLAAGIVSDGKPYDLIIFFEWMWRRSTT